MKKIKVLFVGQQAPLKDGIAHHNTNIMESLSRIKTLQISCLHNQTNLTKLTNVSYIKFNPLNYRKLVVGYDIVHFQFGSSYLGDFVNLALLLTPRNKYIVSTLHDFSNFNLSKYYRILKENPSSLGYSLFNVSIGNVLSKSDRIIVYSGFFNNLLVKKYPSFSSKIKVLFHGVFLTPKSRKSVYRQDLNVCSFGSITPRKGYQEPIEAVSLLLKDGYKINYDIYGYSPFKFYAKRLHKLIGYDSIKIRNPIPSDKIISVLRKYDLIIIPRKYTNEGASGSLSYAISSEVPIVTVDYGSFKEYISHNETGFCVPHTTNSYYKILKDIMDNRVLLGGFSRNIRSLIIKNLSWKKISSRHLKIYRGVFDDQ